EGKNRDDPRKIRHGQLVGTGTWLQPAAVEELPASGSHQLAARRLWKFRLSQKEDIRGRQRKMIEQRSLDRPRERRLRLASLPVYANDHVKLFGSMGAPRGERDDYSRSNAQGRADDLLDIGRCIVPSR